MTHRNFLPIIAVCLLATVSHNAAESAMTVGFLSKVIADVEKKDIASDWMKAKKGETLGTGDRVRTGEKSMAIIKLMDNSLVRIRELSEVTVTGSMQGANFSKTIDIRTGVIGFSVQKQHPGEDFKFTSPTSVASIRGTGGSFNASAAGDTLTVVEGTVNLYNIRSKESLDIPAGFTGISTPDGKLLSHPSTADERQKAEGALIGESQKNLEFDLRDSQGN